MLTGKAVTAIKLRSILHLNIVCMLIKEIKTKSIFHFVTGTIIVITRCATISPKEIYQPASL